MEYYNNILCYPAYLYYHQYKNGPGKGEIIKENYVTYSAYKLQVYRGKINIVRQGKGEGNYALIEFASIPKKYRDLIQAKYGDIESVAKKTPFLNQISKDYEAAAYFATFTFPDGSHINCNKVDNIKLWTNNASILNAISIAWQKHINMRAKLGKKPLKNKFFENASEFVRCDELNNRFENNLPRNSRMLQQKFFTYVKAENNYYTLIKKNKGLRNAEKITSEIVEVLKSIATMATRPYDTKVVEYYLQFMRGEREIFDPATGEAYDYNNYLDKNGNIVEFSESAVWQRLNNPAMQVVLDKKRYGHKDYNDIHRPHVHRHKPYYALSKISMDDRDLIWKAKDTKKRIKAYYAYDVLSGCRIGSSYSRDKNEALFLDCLRDMFVFQNRYNLGIPLEVEVENHLVRKFQPILEQMFPMVTWCAPANSQQKRAEHINRAVKYEIEKNNHPGVGRWNLKSKYNRISADKVDDKFLQTMKPADRLIIDDIQDTLEFNNALHPDQNSYPGMTRIQVLLDNVNPDLPKFEKRYIYQYIGEKTKTSIVRSQYIKVQSAKYMLPHPEVLQQLKPNNRNVVAYWLPTSNGEIPEVYIYQDHQYICTSKKIIEFNEAKAERTNADLEAKLVQDKYIAEFDRMVKDGVLQLSAVDTFKKTQHQNTPEPEVVTVPDIGAQETIPEPELVENDDYANRALQDFFQ